MPQKQKNNPLKQVVMAYLEGEKIAPFLDDLEIPELNFLYNTLSVFSEVEPSKNPSRHTLVDAVIKLFVTIETSGGSAGNRLEALLADLGSEDSHGNSKVDFSVHDPRTPKYDLARSEQNVIIFRA